MILAPYVDDLNAPQFIISDFDFGHSAMGLAAKAGHLKVIKFLAQFVDPTALPSGTTDGEAPIFSAIINGQSEAVKLLAKTLEIKAWREYKFEFSRLPIAITNSANIRILNLKSKQEKN